MLLSCPRVLPACKKLLDKEEEYHSSKTIFNIKATSHEPRDALPPVEEQGEACFIISWAILPPVPCGSVAIMSLSMFQEHIFVTHFQAKSGYPAIGYSTIGNTVKEDR